MSDAATMVERLIAIWSRTLQTTEAILPDSNFFDLGGDSLLAVNLFLEIERAMAHHFPITTIYDAPTVAELAALMEAEVPAKFSPLVLLKEGGHGEPLFIVHGVGGTVFDLVALGKLIESDGPVYAIQARGVDGQDAPLSSIDEMADYYADVVREISPRGPYRLAGYSFGGVVAVEMARRLLPENVDKLILLDAFAHPQTWPRWSRTQVSLFKLAQRVRDNARHPDRLLSSVTSKARRVVFGRKPQHAPVSRAEELNSWLGAISPDLPLPLRETRIAGGVALVSFWTHFYPGQITFLRAGKVGMVFPANARTVWQHLVKKMELHTIEGSHASIVAEHAASTAKAISECLASEARPARRPYAAPVGAQLQGQMS